MLEQRRARLELELLLETSLNAEDVERAQGDGKAAVAERDRRFMKLFADYQLQKTHLARALTDSRSSDRMRQDAEREAERLRGHIGRLEVRRPPLRQLCRVRALPRVAVSAIACVLLAAGWLRWRVTERPARVCDRGSAACSCRCYRPAIPHCAVS